MIKTSMKTALPVAIAIALSACSSDNPTSNSGYISMGTITGFGSIYVNGVEFETDSSGFDVDGESGTQADLAIGMQVGIMGTINDDGVTGTATQVDFDEEIQGPVSAITVGDGQTRTFTVLGTNVIIDIDDTNFDDDSGTFDFATIENNDNVEISGFYDAMDTLHATRIELEDADFDATSTVEVEGAITGLSGTTFMIGSLIVDASAAELDDLPNGLVEGVEVEVKGTYDISSNTLTATKVEGEDDSLAEGEEMEFEGFITRYVSDSDFDVSGHPVDASSAEKEPSTLVLALDLQVEVEGHVVNGILIAEEVKTREDSIHVAATVDSVDTAAGTFALGVVAGQPTVTVRITTTTELEDEVSGLEPFSITDIQTSDFIEVEGYINDAGELEAGHVHRENTGEIVLEGIITASDQTGMTVTVLGISFSYDGTTVFEKDGTTYASAGDFFADVTNNTSTIEVVDTNADGTAESIFLEE